MSVRSHETQFEQSYERKTKNGVDVLLAATVVAPFCCIHRKDTFRHFPLLWWSWRAVLNFGIAYLYKTKKNKTKNFNRTAILWHFRKQVGVIVSAVRL